MVRNEVPRVQHVQHLAVRYVETRVIRINNCQSFFPIYVRAGPTTCQKKRKLKFVGPHTIVTTRKHFHVFYSNRMTFAARY